MPKATKKVSRKNTSSVVSSDTVMPMSAPVMTAPVSRPMNTKLMTFALLAVLIALLTYKVGPKLVPAMVGSSVVTRFELWSRLEKSYGAQVLDDMVNEKILDKAILDSKIKVDQAKVDEQIKTLETQFESTGGLEEALKQRGLSRADLEKQIKTQLAVEEILADKITPNDEEIQAQFDAGSATVYKDKKIEEVKEGITEELKQTKLRDEFLVWFGEVKKSVKVKNYGL